MGRHLRVITDCSSTAGISGRFATRRQVQRLFSWKPGPVDTRPRKNRSSATCGRGAFAAGAGARAGPGAWRQAGGHNRIRPPQGSPHARIGEVLEHAHGPWREGRWPGRGNFSAMPAARSALARRLPVPRDRLQVIGSSARAGGPATRPPPSPPPQARVENEPGTSCLHDNRCGWFLCKLADHKHLPVSVRQTIRSAERNCGLSYLSRIGY